MKDQGNHPFVVAARRIACHASGPKGITVEEASDYIAGEVWDPVWQPIDTAPRRQPILGTWGDIVATMYWTDIGETEWYCPGVGSVTPTHWIPLPKPPTS